MFGYEEIKKLNELEITMYNYIIAHAEQVGGMTIRQLSESLNVSSTTILRFCSKFGCEGYSEFKYRFREYLKTKRNKDVSYDVTAVEDFFEKIKDGKLNKEIRRVAEVICYKSRVFFWGVSTSGTMGKYGAHYLSKFGKYATYIDDPFYPTGNNSSNDTIVIVISVSGEKEFLLRKVQELKKEKITIVSITNSKQCTLAKISDYNLSYYIPEVVLSGGYNVTSSIPVVYIIETMSHYVNEILG